MTDTDDWFTETVTEQYRVFVGDRGSRSTPPAVHDATGEIEAVANDLLAELTGDDAFEDYLRAFIRTEADRLQGGEREARVCRCDTHGCPLKAGEVPARLRRAEDTREAIETFEARHERAPVLQEAREQFRRDRRELKRLLDHGQQMVRRESVWPVPSDRVDLSAWTDDRADAADQEQEVRA